MTNRLTRATAAGPPAEAPATQAVTDATAGEQPGAEPYAAQRAFLGDLAGRGITVRLTDQGGLAVSPWPQVEEADRERLRRQKAEITELLSADVEVLEPPPKQPRKIKLVGGRRNRKPVHRGEPRPTDPDRPFSRRGQEILRERQLITIANRERGRPDIATMLAEARERIGR